MFDCENCWYYDYDAENDVNYCRQFLDEDEVARALHGKDGRCPYFHPNDEYEIAKKQ